MKKGLLLILNLILIANIYGQNKIVGSTVSLNATFHNISIHIDIAGDDNLDSQCQIEYRKSGDAEFSQTAKVVRAFPSMIVDGQALGRNHFAGSAMFLEPNTLYAIVITIVDPDNESSIYEEQTIITRSFPVASTDGTTLYVVPGNGGGQGTESDPYQGLQSAADNAGPGDVVLAMPGTYSSFGIRNNGNSLAPITFLSQELHQAVIDGGDTDRGIITVGDFDLNINNIIIDGFRIKNGAWGIDAQHSAFITVQNNIIEEVDFGYINRRESNKESDQYITNNVFEGRTDWPQLNGEIPPGRAIDIRGNNNVVSFNTISGFSDGVSTDGPPYKVSYSLDIYNNEISDVVDDFIEVDGIVSNARVYNNRGFNGRMGVSVAPIFGGPVYVFRNVFYNMELSTFKMNRKPAGLIIAHNLGVKSGNGTSSDAGWQNTFIQNNIIMGTRYCFEEYGQIDMNTEDWDYNAYFSTRAGMVGDEWFKWQNVRYANVDELASNTSIESHGLAIGLSDLEIVFIPQNYGVSYSPLDQDHRPSSNSSLIDMGNPLVNMNDPYVTDGKPDIGPYEFGQELPQYGVKFEIMTSSISTNDNISCRLAPNPTSGMLRITGEGAINSVNVYNDFGFLLLSQQVQNNMIDITNFVNGIYWIELIDVNAVKVKNKIVLIR